MVSLIILAPETASLAVDAATGSAAPAVLTTALLSLLIWAIKQPLLWSFALPALVQVLKKALPKLAAGPAGVVRGVAILLGAAAGILMAWASGDLTTLDSQVRQIQDGVLAIGAAFGWYNLRPGTWGAKQG